MMIHVKDASDKCRMESSPNMKDIRGITFYQQANIEQI